MDKPNETFKGPSQRHSWWSRNWFYTALISIAIIGSFCAFCLPLLISEPFRPGDSVATLRQAILAATGGVLAMLTLWENRRKNLQEKDKNDLDHTRQVKAERRSRYAKAIEQLAHEKGTIRIGGVYTLVKLVDEWMSDKKTVSDATERKEEGQVIINNLCSYLRSPYTLADYKEILDNSEKESEYDGDFRKDRAEYREEQEVRMTILEEIRARLSSKGPAPHKDIQELLPGSWSEFNFNFLDANFFYLADFSDCVFNASTNFSKATFEEYANFSGTQFFQKSTFGMTVFKEEADFSETLFNEYTVFNLAQFLKISNFSHAVFSKQANLGLVLFAGESIFNNAKFKNETTFTFSFFGEKTSFINCNFKGESYFNESKFARKSSFAESTFTGITSFSDIQTIDNIEFSAAKFSLESIIFPDTFEIAGISPSKIETEEITVADGRVFTIPVGCELFDPEPLPAPKPKEKPTE